ncbi:MAG: ABC transporter permease [Ardenticatenales bacterium]|nr:ABC transporter permease [Ardenticatenales bacterium]MCB9171992.1 ABC transporter permease [Ardenticatenales bacterium]
MALIASILAVTLRAGTSLLYATIGEIFAERAGILNLGVEGMMLMGAVSGFAVAFHSGSAWLGLVVAILVGTLMAAIHAFLTITLRADQVVSGLALTIFGIGASSFLGERLGPGGTPLVGLQGPRFTPLPIPVLSDLPLVGRPLFSQDLLTYALYLIVPLCSWYIYRTRAGLNLRAVGEAPRTADAMGLGVARIRYGYTLLGGAFAGLGGAALSLAYTPGWTENLTGGRGWIAVALVIFALWDPARAVLGALLFGGINAIQFRMQAEGTTIPASFLNMLPYIMTVLVMIAITLYERVARGVGAPAALGLPYHREERGG